MTYPPVLDLCVLGARVSVTAVVICWVLGFSKETLYKWKRNTFSQCEWDDAH
jgi:hypothetical protein